MTGHPSAAPPGDPRLRALAATDVRPLTIATAPEGDAAAILTAVADRLLERVAAHASVLQSGAGRPDDLDRVIARAMLADLAAIAGAWRARDRVAGHALDAAAAALADARQIVERALGRFGED